MHNLLIAERRHIFSSFLQKISMVARKQSTDANSLSESWTQVTRWVAIVVRRPKLQYRSEVTDITSGTLFNSFAATAAAKKLHQSHSCNSLQLYVSIRLWNYGRPVAYVIAKWVRHIHSMRFPWEIISRISARIMKSSDMLKRLELFKKKFPVVIVHIQQHSCWSRSSTIRFIVNFADDPPDVGDYN